MFFITLVIGKGQNITLAVHFSSPKMLQSNLQCDFQVLGIKKLTKKKKLKSL